MTVANAIRLDVVGRQQQARVFDAAARNNVEPRGNSGAITMYGLGSYMVDAGRIFRRLNPRKIGVQQHLDFIAVQNVRGSPRTEAFSYVVKTPEPGGKGIRIKRGRVCREFVPKPGPVAKLPETQFFMSQLKLRRQIACLNRPPAVRYPMSLAEIQRIEQGATAAPDVGCPTKKSQA